MVPFGPFQYGSFWTLLDLLKIIEEFIGKTSIVTEDKCVAMLVFPMNSSIALP
jgi:hypothetical protein